MELTSLTPGKGNMSSFACGSDSEGSMKELYEGWFEPSRNDVSIFISLLA
jgi:hypothetical protein